MYSTDFYKTSDKELIYLFSVSGSNAPYHFEDAKTMDDVNRVAQRLREDNDTVVWDAWPVPWEDSKTSDDCVVFEIIEPKKWQFWKNKQPVKFWLGTFYQKYDELKDTRSMYFTDIPMDEHLSNFGEDEHWKLDRLKIFTLPQMKVKSLKLNNEV